MATTKGFIAVHAGAGYHSTDKEKEYRAICKRACMQAMEILQNGGNALVAVTKAVTALEDSPLTNAGMGSNLTLEGRVECDASVMDGTTLTFGAVGCITDVQNPVQVAHRLVETQLQGCLSLGRIPPSILVGPGARQWAQEQNLQLTKEGGLVTETSRRTYIKYKRKLDRKSSDGATKSQTSAGVKRMAKESDMIGQSTDEHPQTSVSGFKKQTRPAAIQTSDRNPQASVSGIKRGAEQDVVLQMPDRSPQTSTRDVEGDVVSHTTDRSPKTYEHSIERWKREGAVSQTCDESHKTSVSDVQRSVNIISGFEDDPEGSSEKSSSVQDTVGGVCVDGEGNVAAASSSGGIWLKQMGRLGPAAHYGAGSWAHNGFSDKTPGVAVVTSGGGEYLIKTLLAKSCAECVQKAENASLGVSSAFRDHFLESEYLSSIESKHGGVLVLKYHKDGAGKEVEVLWAHTTDSMCVGYMLHSDPKPKTFISRLPTTSLPGKSFAMEGKNFRIEETDSDSSD